MVFRLSERLLLSVNTPAALVIQIIKEPPLENEPTRSLYSPEKRLYKVKRTPL